jgi:hypothetical protein
LGFLPCYVCSRSVCDESGEWCDLAAFDTCIEIGVLAVIPVKLLIVESPDCYSTPRVRAPFRRVLL